MNIVFFALILSVLTNCEKLIDSRTDKPYAEIEKKIRNEYDHHAVFTWSQYKELLNKLKQDKFTVLPIDEMRSTFDNSKVIVGLRHDVDFNPFKALEMAQIEKGYGIRATYFLFKFRK